MVLPCHLEVLCLLSDPGAAAVAGEVVVGEEEEKKKMSPTQKTKWNQTLMRTLTTFVGTSPKAEVPRKSQAPYVWRVAPSEQHNNLN